MSNKYTTSAAKNALAQTLHKTANEAGNPADEQVRIGYGAISEVDYDTSQVKVKMYRPDGSPGEELTKGFLPVLNPLSQIHMNYGLLREGLVCRIYYRGKLDPSFALIEVIGDEELSFLQKAPEANEIQIGPFLIFGPGL